MKTKSCIFSLCLLLGFFSAFSQSNFEVPENIVLSNQDDYTRYEPAIIDAAKWLEATDLDKELDKRRDVMGFVLRWLEGSKAVTVELTEPIGKLFEKNDLLLGIFLASYSRNALENKTSPSKFNATKAALISMITIYKKGITISKNKQMEKAIKMEGEGKLDEFVTDVLKVQKG